MDFLLADCALEIRNGFLQEFPDATIINCNFHVQSNIDKRLKVEVKDEKERNRLKRDIRILQLSKSKEVFVVGAQLLISKWERQFPNMIKYFKQQYVDQRSNWYEGLAVLTPSSNNAQESTNAKIKMTFTNRRRISMQEMKNLSGEMIKNWSLDLRTEKPFVDKVEYTEKEIIDGYLWAKRQIEIIKDPDDSVHSQSEELSTTVYWVCASEEKNISRRIIQNIKAINYKTFDSFARSNFEAYDISIFTPIDDATTVIGTCSCKEFFKNFKCLHIIGIAIRSKAFYVETKLKKAAKEKFESNCPLPGGKRSVGRPKNATKALMKN